MNDTHHVVRRTAYDAHYTQRYSIRLSNILSAMVQVMFEQEGEVRTY